jgi:hypothetical protein
MIYDLKDNEGQEKACSTPALGDDPLTPAGGGWATCFFVRVVGVVRGCSAFSAPTFFHGIPLLLARQRFMNHATIGILWIFLLTQ